MTLMVLLLLVLFFFTRRPFAAEADPVRLGEMQIFPLIDAQGTSPISLLFGATEGQIAQYVPSGKLNRQILAFLVRLPGRNVLFDTGLGVSKGGKMTDALKKEGVAPSDIDAILLTHLDPDHFGGLVDGEGRAVFPKAEVYLSRIERNWRLNERKDDNVKKALAPYESRLHLFDCGDSPIPGITAVDISGHTPGHTAFHIKSGDGELFIVGDVLHFAEIQLPLPQVAVTYDVDKEKASQARQRILDIVAERHIPVAGMHFTVPGLWRITKDGAGYEKSPLE